MKKITVVLTMVLCLGIFVLSGCVENNTPIKYAITVSETENGTVTTDVNRAQAGDNVTITITPDSGYEYVEGSLKVNGEVSETTFTMPAENVTITASFEKIFKGIADPLTQTDLVIEAKSGNATATSSWYFTYGANALDVVVKVTDANRVTGTNDSDGISLLVNPVMKVAGLPDGVVSVVVNQDGTTKTAILTGGEYLDATSNQATASVTSWSNDGESWTGYKVEVSIPYALFGADDYLGKLAIAPTLMNKDNALISASEVTSNLYGCEKDSVNTFMVINENNTVEENTYLQLSYTFGNTANYTYAGTWDLSKDYEPSDPNYASRSVKLEAPQFDNDLFMYRVADTTMYAEATFTPLEVYNNEEWGKYGLALVNNGFGIFFYIDGSNGGSSDVNAMQSTNVGFVKMANGEWQWPGNEKSTATVNSGAKELAIARVGNILKLYVDGELLFTTAAQGIDSETPLNFSVKSFNIGIEVTNYRVTNDLNDEELKEAATFTPEVVDYLFIGDSYMDVAFWRTFEADTADLGKTANIGVGGTKVAYWLEIASTLEVLYDAKNIVIHISVNDINVDNTSANEVYRQLVALYEMLHQSLPNANLYWISLSPNTMFASNYATYQEVNAQVAELAAATSYLNYLEVGTKFLDNENNIITNYYSDGLHFNLFGYAVLVETLYDAFGVEYVQGSQMGSNGNLAPTSGWDVSHDDNTEDAYIESVDAFTGDAEQVIWYSGLQGANLYFTVDISVVNRTAADDYTKAGITLRNGKNQILYYIDATNNAGEFNNNNVVGYVQRPVISPNGFEHQGNWTWVSLNLWTQSIAANYLNGQFKTLSVLKEGATIYFIADGMVVLTYDNFDYIGADDEVSVGLTLFNLHAIAKNYYGTTDAAEIATIKEELGITNGNVKVDGNLSDWGTDLKAECYEISSEADGAKGAKVYAYTGDSGVYIGYEVVHPTYRTDAPEWHVNTNVEIVFNLNQTTFQVFASARKTQGYMNSNVGLYVVNTVYDNATQLYTTTWELLVYYKVLGYSQKPEEVKVKFACKTGGDNGLSLTEVGPGDWWCGILHPYVLDNYPFTVTDNGIKYYQPSEANIDGDLGDWNASKKATSIYIPVQDNRSVNVYAFKGTDGIYVGYEVVHFNYINNQSLWFDNTNVEFVLNDGVQRFVSANGPFEKTITNAKMKTQFIEGKYYTTVEIFIHKDLVSTFDTGVTGGFAWKTPGEACDYFFGAGDFWFSGNREPAVNSNMLITENGFAQVTNTDPKYTIDGSLAEWDASVLATAVRTELSDNRYFEMVAVKGTDGIYVAEVAVHRSNYAWPYWCFNTNTEFRIGEFHGYVAYTGTNITLYTGAIGNAKMVTTYDEETGLYTTVMEAFVSYDKINNYDVNSAAIPFAWAWRSDNDVDAQLNAQSWYTGIANGVRVWDDINKVTITNTGLVIN